MANKINSKHIDILNIGLIVVSLVIAIYLPFKLFLFSYAILGPLHYITEINWLKDKNFFIQNPKVWTIPLILISILLGLYGMLTMLEWTAPKSVDGFISMVESNYGAFILAGFLFAVSLIFLRKRNLLIISFFLSLIVSYALNYSIPKSFIMIGIFVPTIVHVYLFTGLFMLWGAKKGKSKYAYFACFTLVFVPIIIYIIPVNETEYVFESGTLTNFLSSNMAGVNQKIAQLFALKSGEKFVLLSELGIRIQIFIAFAYTYHYLNWFSKTSVIGWKKGLNQKKIAFILLLWLSAVVLYVSNYKQGFIALFFLSFLHVFLEFPLNVITIKDLFKR